MEFKSLNQIGHSKGIILPKAVLAVLGAGPNPKYRLRVTGPGKIEIEFQAEREAFIDNSLDKFAKKYDKAMKVLAGND